MIRVGVIGYGYWGPNIVRNFNNGDLSRVMMVCDQRPESLRKVQQSYPQVSVTRDSAELINSPLIDVVAVVTPVWTHFELAKAALKNGKHVFVEKPFTFTSRASRRIGQSGRAEESPHHGGPHLPIHRCGQEDPSAHRRRNLGQSLLLRFHPRQSRTLSARCQRHLGSALRTTSPSWIT